jgi:hypothetical protein
MVLSADRLAKLSCGGPLASSVSDADIDSLVAFITSPAGSLFGRGLAVAALGASLCSRRDAPSALQNLALVDSLVDIIGLSKETKPEALGINSDVIFRIRSNCCVLLSTIMGYVAGDEPPRDDDTDNQPILPMEAEPAPFEPPQCESLARRVPPRARNAERSPCLASPRSL